jgi:hypothetical protein
MREGVLSASVFGIVERVRPAVKEQEVHREVVSRRAEWSEEAFARQQIRNLVRQVFSPAGQAARHVVFSGVEMDADVNGICWCVGKALACEEPEDVLVVVNDEIDEIDGEVHWATQVRSRAKRVDRNLWRLSVPAMKRRSSMNIDGLRAIMAEIRREFVYCVVADSVGGWSGRASLAECADGMVLVLSALKTRRASARRLLDELSHVRLLGTVLQDREFPIPEGIYHLL